MLGRMNRKKAVKVISLGLSIYMALVPVAVHADELSEAEKSLAEQIEVKEEAAEKVEQAVEKETVTDSQAEFENMEIVASVDVGDENISDDTSALVEEEINLIENEAIKEATEAIVNVDMGNVDEALDKVTELITDTITDETVATQIEATADALISVYDTQAEVALNALKEISEEMDAVTVSDDGTVNIDWDAASEEVIGLYETYQAALASKEETKTAKSEVVEKKNAISDKINELNGGAINNNKEKSEAISNSKQSKSSTIDELIAGVAELHSKDIKNGYSYDQKVSGSSDIYRFYINLVEDGVAYGCLTYYDSASKTILRKNFKISADGIDYNYVPKDEWVKENANCEKVVFGNGGNYIAAYLDNTSGYIKDGKTFDGTNVSNLMRANVNLNNDIDARNQALNDLEEINQTIEKAEAELKDASDNADNALKAYKDAVAMYKKAAALDGEIKNSEVEKAKLEYVKAEVELWRRQQELDQIKNTINNTVVDKKPGAVNNGVYENIETVINNIADNLDAEPEAVEEMVAQIVIDTENSYVDEAINSKNTAVLGARKNRETVGINEKAVKKTENLEDETEVETVENVVATAEEMTVKDSNNTLDAAQELVIIEDEEVPLANYNAAFGYGRNWWLPLIIIALVSMAVIMYIVVKREQEED